MDARLEFVGTTLDRFLWDEHNLAADPAGFQTTHCFGGLLQREDLVDGWGDPTVVNHLGESFEGLMVIRADEHRQPLTDERRQCNGAQLAADAEDLAAAFSAADHEGAALGEHAAQTAQCGAAAEVEDQVVALASPREVCVGEVGRRVVKYLKAFGCRILVSDPYVQLSADDLKDGVIQCSFDRVLEDADVLTLHPRVTAETTKMMNAETLRRMKKDATLVNTARGPLLDYDALYHVMSTGHLRGAMLETFSVEPVPPDAPLLHLPNVTLTPHIAGASVKTVRYAAGLAAEEVRRYFAGEGLLNRC